MESKNLEHWDDLSEDVEYDLIKLTLDAPLICEVDKEGIIQLQTGFNKGYSNPDIMDKGRTYDEWIGLLEEAKKIYEHYFKKNKQQ